MTEIRGHFAIKAIFARRIVNLDFSHTLFRDANICITHIPY